MNAHFHSDALHHFPHEAGATIPPIPSDSHGSGVHPFKGYTLEEIRYRRLANRLRMEVTKEKLIMMVSPQARRESGVLSGALSGFQSIMRWVDIAMVAYTVTRRISNFLGHFRQKRR